MLRRIAMHSEIGRAKRAGRCSPRPGSRFGRFGLIVILLLPLVAMAEERPEGTLFEAAKRFAHAALEGDAETVRMMATDQLVRVVNGPQGDQIRQTLATQVGEFVAFGDPWVEERTEGFDRVRMPATFAQQTVDLRVAIDLEGKIAGFLMAPSEAAATPADAEATPESPDSAASTAPSPSPPEGVHEIDLMIGDDATGLPARLSLPSGSGPFAGAILVHGSGPHGMDGTVGPNPVLRDIAWGLASRGVAVLRYDKRSFARPQTLMAAGDALTVEEEVMADARAAVALLRTQTGVARARVFVIGHSLGGSLAPRIAAGIEPLPAGIVSLAGLVRPMPETILQQVRYNAGADGTVDEAEKNQIDQVAHAIGSLRAALDDPSVAPPSVPMMGVPFAYWKDFDDYDPPSAAAALAAPVLIIQGGRDYQVIDEDFAGWKAGLAGKADACFVHYARLDHLMRAGDGPSKAADYQQAIPVDSALLDDLATWLREGRCPTTT